MKHPKIFALAVILTVILIGFDALAIGPGLVTGPEAREWFEIKQYENCWMFLDFENIPNGVHAKLFDDFDDGFGLLLKTTEFRWPLPPVIAPANTPVAVLPYNYVSTPPNHRLMGVTHNNIPDGQSKYEIEFESYAGVQAVGLLRMWNNYSITRFYNVEGNLLAEHRNTTNQEFVGWIGGDKWWVDHVKRIEFDGAPSAPDSEDNKLYQVGEVDDLFFSRSSLVPKIEEVPSQVKIGDTIKAKFIIKNLGNYNQDNIKIFISFYSHEQKQDIHIELIRNFEPNETKTLEYVLPITSWRDPNEVEEIKFILHSPLDKYIANAYAKYELIPQDNSTSIGSLLQLLLQD
jgi:hypothetical protein